MTDFRRSPASRADAFAALSQHRVQRAYDAGVIQESLVLGGHAELRTGLGPGDGDEPPRPGTTVDVLARLRTPFRPHGRVTAGNAAGLNDGATACLVAAESVAEELGCPSLCAWCPSHLPVSNPEVMGVGRSRPPRRRWTRPA